jgi:hypothetical protein
MNTADLQVFNQAVQLANSGNKPYAYQQLKALEPNNPQDTNLLLWLAFTTSDLNESGFMASRIAAIEPANANLPSLRSWLEGEKTKQQQAPPPPQFQQMAVPQLVYYAQPAQPPIPGKQISGTAVFGYFFLYFIFCGFLAGVIYYVAYNTGPYLLYRDGSKEYTGDWVAPALIGLVVITSIWAAIDAGNRQTRFGRQAGDSAAGAFFGCLLIWVIIFPLYLARRRKSIAYFGQ